jgi:hypothetical protein
MQWVFYAGALAIAVLAARMWIGYLDQLEKLLDERRALRRSVLQTSMAIEERGAQRAAANDRLALQKEEAAVLHSELDSLAALLHEMIRTEQRRSPDAIEEGFLGQPSAGGGA